MGNRAVIVSHDTTKENQTNKLGIYVHWCGGEENVKAWLKKAKELGVRDVDSDSSYFWARLCQIITNDFSESGETTLSVGIDIVQQLDTNNWDNGVYYIDNNFEIVKHTDGEEFIDIPTEE